jgi:phthiodiolone/phenolphthiodiolone dimycocerosates ketoreductase
MTYIPGSMADDATQYAREIAVLRQAAQDAGRDLGRQRVMPIILSVVHDDAAAVEEILQNPLMKWNALGTTPTGATFRAWGREHPLGDDWTFSRDSIPPWMPRDEVLDLLAKVPDGAMAHTVFAGNSQQVFDRLQPWLEAGVTDAMILNWAPFCGLEYAEGARREEVRLLDKLREYQSPQP